VVDHALDGVLLASYGQAQRFMGAILAFQAVRILGG